MSELPAQWCEVSIGSFARVVGGGTPPSKDPANFAPPGQGIPWLTPADLSGYRRQTVERGARDLTPVGFAACGATLLPKGSVLFSSRAPIGYVAIAANEISTNQGFKSFVLPDGFDSRFCYYQLKHLKPEAEAIATGTTFKELSGAAAATLPFKVAPLNEQTRIADHLDTLLVRIKACNDHLDAIPGLLKRFRQAVLDAAVAGSLTHDWREARELPAWQDALIADCGQVTGGLTKNSKRESFALRKPYLRVANVQSNRLDLADVSEIGLTHAEHEKTKLQRGDLLIVEGNGSIDQVGRVAIWSEELKDCVHQNHLIRLRPAGVCPEWLLYWLLSSPGRAALMERASTTTGLYTLSISKVSSVPIRLPSPQEQSEVVDIVKKLLAVAEQIAAFHRKAALKARQLEPRTLAKAFRGDLLPQDPSDEPASALLARLAAERNQASAAPKARKARARRAARTLPSTSSPSKAMPSKSRQDEDVKGQPYLAAHLRRLGQPVDAKTLYEASELPVADFYKQLAWEIAEGHVNDAAPLLEPARHAA